MAEATDKAMGRTIRSVARSETERAEDGKSKSPRKKSPR
jgi:hypothetical protein